MQTGLLEAQVAVVTGGGRGVGRAVALRLAEAGATVVIAARTEKEIDEVAREIRAAGGRAAAVQTDVTDEAAVARMVAAAEGDFGAPTLLVNVAGSWRHVGPVEDADVADWWGDVESNLKSVFLCARAVLPSMLARGTGRIVNVASYAGARPGPFATAYAASKAAVLRFSDSLAAEVEDRGVHVFAVTPGFVWTRLNEDMLASESGRRYFAELADRQDAVEPERLGDLVITIASGRLDPLTGMLLHALDDVDALLEHADEAREQGLHTLRLRT